MPRKGLRPHKAKVLERRRNVARLRAVGRSYREIATEVKCSVSTVCLDIAAIEKDWAAEAREDIDRYKGKLLAELEDQKQEAYGAWFESKKDAVEVTRKGPELIPPDDDSLGGNPEEVAVPIAAEVTEKRKGQTGDHSYLEQRRKCIDSQSKILGITSANNTYNDNRSVNIETPQMVQVQFEQLPTHLLEAHIETLQLINEGKINTVDSVSVENIEHEFPEN